MNENYLNVNREKPEQENQKEISVEDLVENLKMGNIETFIKVIKDVVNFKSDFKVHLDDLKPALIECIFYNLKYIYTLLEEVNNESSVDKQGIRYITTELNNKIKEESIIKNGSDEKILPTLRIIYEILLKYK